MRFPKALFLPLLTTAAWPIFLWSQTPESLAIPASFEPGAPVVVVPLNSGRILLAGPPRAIENVTQFFEVGTESPRAIATITGFRISYGHEIPGTEGLPRLLLGGSAAVEGELFHSKRIVELDPNGNVKTLWDSARLPVELGAEPVVEIDDSGRFWVVLTGIVEGARQVGGRIIGGLIPKHEPSWAVTVRFSSLEEHDSGSFREPGENGIAPIGSSRAAVLIGGRAYLIVGQGERAPIPLMIPNPPGRLVAYHSESSSLLFADEGRGLVVFHVGSQPPADHPHENALEPVGVLDAEILGFEPGWILSSAGTGLILNGRVNGEDVIAKVDLPEPGSPRSVTVRAIPGAQRTWVSPDGSLVCWRASAREGEPGTFFSAPFSELSQR